MLLSGSQALGIKRHLDLPDEALMKARIFILTCVFLLVLGVITANGANVLSAMLAMTSSESVTLLLVGSGFLFVSNQIRKLKTKSAVWHHKILNFQHYINPLHFYCRLVKYGINNKTSIWICRWYEAMMFKWVNWTSVKVDGFLIRLTAVKPLPKS